MLTQITGGRQSDWTGRSETRGVTLLPIEYTYVVMKMSAYKR